jgi:hypothetical protein
MTCFLSPELEMAGKLMTKLSTLKEGGRFRLMTSLRQVKRNVTRWTGVPELFDRLERLLPSLQNANEEVVHLLPISAQVLDHKQVLADFKSVTLALQSPNMSLKDSNALFDLITKSYTVFNFHSYLGLGALIVHTKDLEAALIKIQSKEKDTLSVSGYRTTERLLLPTSHQQEEEKDDGLSFAERELKRQRQVENESLSRYIDTRFCATDFKSTGATFLNG